MAVTEQIPLNQSTGNGSSFVFPFNFKVLASGDLVVTVDGVVKTLGVDYSASGIGNANGGTVTFFVAPAALSSVVIYRDTTLERTTDYQDNGDLLADGLNADLDRPILVLQEIFGGGKGVVNAIRAPNGETLSVLPNAAARALRIQGFDANGDVALYVGVDANSATALQIDLANIASAAKASGQIGYNASLNYVAQTLGAALNESSAEMMWFITSEAERANIKAGTSSTDHTATIQGALALIGARELHFGDKGQWNINATLAPSNGQTLGGKAKIRAINGAQITGAMVKGTAVTRVTVRDLELDANAANNGANYGVWFASGSRNLIENVYVHDTCQAGAVLESEDSSRVVGGQYINCGRSLTVTGGGATDNHGVMIYSTSATAVKNCSALGVRVSGAYRKGITTYSNTPGTVLGITISNCLVDSCGVTPSSGGGIYVANAAATTDQDSITLTGNTCWSNYVNYLLSTCKRVAGGGNVSRNSVAQGIVIETCNDASLPGFQDSDAGTDGVLVNSCVGVALGTLSVRRANRSAAANGAGLHLSASTFCTVAPGSIVYDETPLQKYAVLEDGASNNNDLWGITTVGALTALWSIIGAATRFGRRDGRNTGFNVALPLNTVHVDGGETFNEQVLTAVNGANQNLALPSNAGTLVINAPTGAYNIGGLQGGHAGRRLTIKNYTGFTLTLNHQDAGSTAANRLTLPSNANKAVPTQGAVVLEYSSIGGGAWFIVGIGS